MTLCYYVKKKHRSIGILKILAEYKKDNVMLLGYNIKYFKIVNVFKEYI